MALFIQQDDDRTELQKRLALELQDKARKRKDLQEAPDGVDDSRYVEDTKRTTSLAGVWLAIVIASIGLFVWLLIQSSAN